MTAWKFMSTTALVALVAGSAAQADVTPEEVWSNWKATATAAGQTVTTASESREGPALVVSGITLTAGDDEVDASVTIDRIALTDNGDGSVAVTMSDSYPLAIRAAGAVGEADTLTNLTVSHPGLAIKVSGSPAEMRYDFTAPSLKVALKDVQTPDQAAVPTDMVAEVGLTGLSGNYIVAGTGDAKAISSNAAADTLSFIMKGTNPEDQSKIDMKLGMAKLAGTSTGKTVGMMGADLAAALKAGFSAEGSFSYAGTTMDMTVTEATGDTRVSASVSGGDLTFVMDAARLGYGATGKDASITMSGPEIPFPQLTLGYKESAFNFEMPVAKGDAPAPFRFLTRLTDLTISDEIWGMFDPTGQLPRDPMTLVLDTKGTARLNVDLMDEAAMSALGEAGPGELNSLDVTALQLKAAGAEITGNGAFTFDNTDLATYGGFPAPTGKLSLKATGVNGLLDKLMAMGLVPEDQMMGARMMLGMFAKVDPANPDTMTSDLEFKGKSFFANGMQLQ